MQPFALVTGTSRGIGQALAARLLEQSWSVVGLARGPAPDALRSSHYTHLSLDLADSAGLEAAVEDLLATRDLEHHGRVALVNNAGLVQPVGSLDRLSLEELEHAAKVNLTAPLWLAGRLLEATPPSTPLVLAHLGSGAATSPYSGWASYCATKAGLAMGARCLAEDVQHMPHLAGRDVRVLDYAPGVVATEMQADLRAVDAGRFPHRARFVGLHEDGALVAPEGPAHELAALLLDADLPAYSTRRFGG